MNSEIEIFLCYAREDERLCRELENQLRVLQKQGLIHVWHDREIIPGKEWKYEIDTHLNTAQIILLLVSPNFMVSDYCYGIEMKRALERHERGEACVIPVILSPVIWDKSPFGKLQALPKDSKPVTTWRNRGKAFFNIAEGVLQAIERSSSTLVKDHYVWTNNEEELAATPMSKLPGWADVQPRRDEPVDAAHRGLALSNVPGWADVQPAGGDRHLPVYLLLNISKSMEGAPIISVQQGLELFQREVSTDPFARDTVKVGVITFSEEARLVTNELMPISKFYSPYMTTNSSKSRLDLAFKVLLQSMDRDVIKAIRGGRKGDWLPVIFVLTDSKPTNENGIITDRLWRQEREAILNRPKGKIKPASIVAVGVGPNIDDATLKNISTGTAFKMGTDAAAFVTLFQYISQSTFASE